ncbi:hypothetical protein RUND412_003389 [Rhizina undulata]
MTIIKLQTGDHKIVEVDLETMRQSIVIRDACDDLGIDEITAIPLPTITSEILAKVIEWCEHHKADDDADDDVESRLGNSHGTLRRQREPIPEWDLHFFTVDQATLFEYILAANYLDIEKMLDYGCRVVAEMIVCRSPQEIRDHFGIECDFTPDELESLQRENTWASETMES